MGRQAGFNVSSTARSSEKDEVAQETGKVIRPWLSPPFSCRAGDWFVRERCKVTRAFASQYSVTSRAVSSSQSRICCISQKRHMGMNPQWTMWALSVTLLWRLAKHSGIDQGFITAPGCPSNGGLMYVFVLMEGILNIYLSADNKLSHLESASQEQSSDTHKIPYYLVKLCRERKKNIKASERVNSPARFPTRENPGAAPPGIEPGSPRWEAGILTTTPPWTLMSSCSIAEALLRYRHGGRHAEPLALAPPSGAGIKGRGETGDPREYPRAKNPGATPQVIEPGSLGWEASSQRTAPTQPLYGAAPEFGGGRNGTSPEKTHRPTASSGTIPSSESPVTRPGIEHGSPWWEASGLTTRPPRPPSAYECGTLVLRCIFQMFVCMRRMNIPEVEVQQGVRKVGSSRERSVVLLHF
ncbi:hypothetical protein PR048_012087 [Dryococelus australis]|uniref:Uncharacterized protein n=1 Tax=Dryococelus australis TaxID=614101 RepID=A0ABQ9HNG2_9NEOP|nr:hypothetical protein PR048_012087 [Dryococelus australis]